MNRVDEIGGGGGLARRRAAADLRGVMLPFPTPFDAGGEVDFAALRHNLARWRDTGVTGFVALGSTGERVHLDEAETKHVIETARADVPDALNFVVGVGRHDTRGTIAEARRAADLGADFVLVITPHFYRGAMTADALAEYYERVADASPAPALIYSIPQNTGVTLAPEAVGRLSRHENIAGLKESSGDMLAFGEMLRAAAGAEFAMLTGHGSAVFAALASGGGGAILAVACCAPRFCVALAGAVGSGDYARAREMQDKLAPLARAVTTRFGVGGLKAALDLAGYRGGLVRAPLRMPDESARNEIARLLVEVEAATETAGASGEDGAHASRGAAQ